MSSYYFTDTDAGPPGVGVNNGANCGNGRDWVSLYNYSSSFILSSVCFILLFIFF
jgi:hypothetical protein